MRDDMIEHAVIQDTDITTKTVMTNGMEYVIVPEREAMRGVDQLGV